MRLEPLLLVGEFVGGFGDAFELWLGLQVEQNCRFFDLAALEDALDDFVAVERLAGLLEYVDDDVADGALGEAPAVEGVDATANEDETLVFDEFVVDGLGGDVFAFEVAVFDGARDVAKVHWLAIGGEDDIDFVADILGVDGGPFGEAPGVVEVREQLAGASVSGDVRGVLVVELGVEVGEAKRLGVLFDCFDDVVDAAAVGFFVTVFGDGNGVVVVVVFGDDNQTRR